MIIEPQYGHQAPLQVVAWTSIKIELLKGLGVYGARPYMTAV